MNQLLPESEISAIANRARSLADRFSLPLNERNWRGNPGDYAGTGVGSSLDFQDHRNYLPGDDPRHINWQAYARTGDYTLKLYREEVRPIVEIIMDVSGSMFAFPDKATRSVELLYFCYLSAEHSGASARIYFTCGPHWRLVEPDTLLTHRWTEVATGLQSSDSGAPPALGSLPFRQRSMRILISDLLFPAPPEAYIRALSRQNGRAVILCPFTSAESDPGWDGNFEFIDAETDSRNDRRVDASLLKRYLASYRRHFDRWKAASIRAQSPFARIPSAGTFAEAVRHEAVASNAIQLS